MRNRWSDDDARGLEGADLVAYTSRLLGAEQSLVVWGGGNSSIKQTEIDYRGREVQVLRVKGSGSDMKSLRPEQITGLRMDDIEAVFERKSMSDQAMVDYLACAKLDPAAPRGSIETLLHGFVPFDHVYHTHADVIAAVTDVPRSDRIIREIYGEGVAWIPYVRPGFELSKRVGSAVREIPDLEGIILDKHGIITYGDSAKGAYARMIELVGRAEDYVAQRRDRVAVALGGARRDPVPVPDRQITAARLAPIIRGALGSAQRQLLAFDDSPEALRFSCWGKVGDISQLGPATPDHLLYTKQRALVLEIAGREVDADLGEEIRRAVAGYAAEYEKYFERYRSSEDLMMLDPFPRTVIVPGIGIFQSGKDVRATIVTRDIYHRSIAAMEAASSISRFEPIGVQDICDFEYWPLENYKLSLLPPEKELSRRVALVTGAGSGIGRAIAAALAEAGSAVGIADIDAEAARSAADQLNQKAGFPQALAIPMDVRDEISVRAGFGALTRAYGGVDIVVANAGIARSAPIVETTLGDWRATMGVNGGRILPDPARSVGDDETASVGRLDRPCRVQDRHRPRQGLRRLLGVEGGPGPTRQNCRDGSRRRRHTSQCGQPGRHFWRFAALVG